MTILYAYHVCMKKITEALVSVTLILCLVRFSQSNLEGKQQQKEESGDNNWDMEILPYRDIDRISFSAVREEI